jgi:uncharacterized protein (DUF1501 family)
MLILSRRRFLSTAAGSTAVVSLGGLVPRFLQQAAAAAPDGKRDTVLVVVQLSGGNDGLNTVVPTRNDAYYRLRPKLAVPRKDALAINDDFGFHPAMRGFADLLQAGELAVVQGVGYANPNRSHFESMDIWHTCFPKQQRPTGGWLGRYLDAAANGPGGDVPALHVGPEQQPKALDASRVRVPSLKSLDEFRLREGNVKQEAAASLVDSKRAGDELVGFLQSSVSTALSASRRVEQAAKQTTSMAKYPETELAGKLQVVARLIRAGLQTRAYYVALDGFDTHAQQAAAHAGLLRQLGDAVAAFRRDLAEGEHGRRVLVMCFSEFGRRVAENASDGTDHGAAAPMFFVGSGLRAGLVGEHPSLGDLDDGDLKFKLDFRQLYATALEDWLGWPSREVLGGQFAKVPLLA